MIKRQASLFPECSKFDYRTLLKDEKECSLDKYFDTELLTIVDFITTSDTTIHAKKTSPSHTHNRKLKCTMICAIMANNMDPRKCSLQTLIGLACYAHGLRDKGMKLLNSFGVTSSIFHIRQHGSFWAKVRKVIKEKKILLFGGLHLTIFILELDCQEALTFKTNATSTDITGRFQAYINRTI